MTRFVTICILLLVFSCKIKYKDVSSTIPKLEINTLIQDSLLNVRSIEISEEGICTFLTSNGELGFILPHVFISHIDSLREKPYYVHKVNLSTETQQLNFRALAIQKDKGYGITIGNPALLYSLDADLNKNKIVYTENHPNVFYDSMEFWNDQEGIAIGDPTDHCMSIIITRDGGKTWTKLNCNKLPKAIDGEAAFAASDTNIAIINNHTWIATGGKVSRILYSSDKGHSWQIFETPIVQGKSTTGMYSVDFYDALNGFAIGGDYMKPEVNRANKIRTLDGGKTWHLVAKNQNPGYRSCVQYVPNSNTNSLVAVGFKGIDYSSDAGKTWTHLSDEGFYTIRFLNDSVAFAAGKGRLSKLIFTNE